MKRAAPRAAAGPGSRRIPAPRPATSAWIPVAGVVLLGLAVRLWAMRYQPWVTIDGTDYINSAEALASGHVTSTAFPPGYPALIALMRVLVHDRVLAATLISVVAGALLPWPVWLLARRAVGERWAIAPALAVALHPILVQYSSVTMSESAYLLALYGALAIAAAGRAAPAGLAIGVAYAIRPEALVPAAALAVRELRTGLRNAASWRSLAFAAGAFLVVAVPCWLFYHALLGEWTVTPKLSAFRVAGETWREEEERFLRSATPAPSAESKPAGQAVVTALQQVPGRAAAHGRSLVRLWPV